MNALDEKKCCPLGPLVISFLRGDGYSEKEISMLTSESRLLQDMREYGDFLVMSLERIRTEYCVDFSGFHFEKYFPLENSKYGDYVANINLLRHFRLNHLFKWCYDKNCKKAEEIHNQYPEITLGMLEIILREKKWIEPDDIVAYIDKIDGRT